MKNLEHLIRNANELNIRGSVYIPIKGFSLDSRSIGKEYCFVARKGAALDGHKFIHDAIDNGATSVLCETLPEELKESVTYIQTAQIGKTLALMLNEFYNYPSDKIKLIGITGTNGKTTTTTLLFNLFRQLGYKCGLISTIKYIIDQEVHESTHTTPDIINLYKLIAQMRDRSCSHIFMEVSSHAVEQERIKDLKFDIAVFTNITQDHLDYHKTFKNYIYAKKKFFDELKEESVALINTDDSNAKVMVQNTKAKVKTFGILNMADYKGKILENSFYGLQLKVNHREIHSSLVGDFNASNLVCVYAVASILGANEDEVLVHMSSLKSVEGRFDWYKNNNNSKIGIVDYAHTPDALEKILQTIQKLKQPQQSIITVIGCGGNRDKTKRPIMAHIAVSNSDKVIFTADNPRDEDPGEIIQEMEAGVDAILVQKYISLVDREQAIKTACLLSNSSDIILVAGKGHEKYQEIKGKKFPFDDMQKLKSFL
ncbi:MAG: UDP-N-acetylmuramoyl-L-alanyl-D-glutamate--2,6-diaminopimelate ligase [Saprospiraceae bacterium]|nr:UDP-N-acetylmuramoyl-L-alanyl-D-glutamate--2,6-diaminopimelate ligase [Saprospiraceae bacterium]